MMKAMSINQIGATSPKIIALQYFTTEMGVNLIVANLSAIMIGMVVYRHVPHHIVWIWLVSIAAISLIRLYQANVFSKLTSTPEAEHYYPQFMFTSLIASLIWGSGIVFFLPHLELIQQAYLVIILLALAAGASVKMPQDIFLLFLVGIGGPSLAWMLFSSQQSTEVLGALFGFALLILWLASRQFDKKLYEAITTGMENRSLVDEMAIQSQALKQSGDAIIIMNHKGIIQYVNPAYLTLSGFSEAEVVGSKAPFLLETPQNKPFLGELWQAIRQNKAWSSRIACKRSNHAEAPALLSVSPVYDINHNLTHLIAIQKDLSEYEALEHKLQHAKKMEALGALTSSIAHDFGNVLANISARTYLLARCTFSEEGKQQLQQMEDITKNGGELIRQLLSFARKDPVKLQPMVFETYIDETITNLDASIPRHIHLDVQLDTRRKTVVHLCPALFQQVVHNLLNNAADAVELTTQPKITVRIAYQDRHIVLSIEDNGTGIEPNELEHIFDPFFTTKTQGKGTGLGLATAYNTVKAHHGDITVQSTPQQGTCFRITLPVASASQVSEQHSIHC